MRVFAAHRVMAYIFREFKIEMVTSTFYYVSPNQFVIFLVLKITFYGRLRISVDVKTFKKWLL